MFVELQQYPKGEAWRSGNGDAAVKEDTEWRGGREEADGDDGEDGEGNNQEKAPPHLWNSERMTLHNIASI